MNATNLQQYAHGLRQEFPEIAAVYLFGSMAKKSDNENSDYDVIVATDVENDETLLEKLIASRQNDTIVGRDVDLFVFFGCDILSVLGNMIGFETLRFWKEGVDYVEMEQGE